LRQRDETRLERDETRLERDEMRLERETRLEIERQDET